ncbi:MAG TPA: ribosomal-processing cysteine protease Prp [Candidatus Limiplasma sp.]|nr:ribosomal-processing cysteine protease Prp [Candidatus Limiplasma sp.]
MTRIVIRREGDRITALKAQGHAGNAAAGENIVCAAVSSLMYTAINAMESVAGVLPAVDKDDRKALINITLPEDCESHEAQIIFRTIVQGLTDISQEYPKWVTITTQDGRTLK